MIEVTRLNGAPILVNPELVQFIEATPDTVISLTTGEKLMVREPADLVAARVRAYRQEVGAAAAPRGEPPEPAAEHHRGT